MNRRDFLVATALAGVGARGWAQPARKRKCAAVVIGVNKTGSLPVLRGAASGATQVGAWLAAEGYDVTRFIDDKNPVKANDIFTAVRSLTQKGIYDQLVVYFAGHGFAMHYAEYWLLSEAPENPNEAISLRESVELSRLYSGIPNVIFISDACRSTADSLRATNVRGSLIFPNSGNAQRSYVDQFMATLVGNPSLEVPVDDSNKNYAGIYTDALMSAFATADRDLVSKVDGFDVVPNRRLPDYLGREVPARAHAINVRLNQEPDAQVTSKDDIYIARVKTLAAGNTAPETPATMSRLAGAQLDLVGLRGILPSMQEIALRDRPQFATSLKALDAHTGFSKAQEHMADEIGVVATSQIALPPRCGFVVVGVPVETVLIAPKQAAELKARVDGRVVSIDLPYRKAASALIVFADGTSTALAALGGYVGSVTVARNGVINVSYVPARESPLYGEFSQPKLRELHASVATAARFGVFRIEREGGARLADTVRMMKSVDPTLGLYAAYAYAQSGIADQVRSVREILRQDLNADLFDTAMLARGLVTPRDRENAFPFCPMLAQGWGLLRVKDVRLPKELDAARDHMRPSLWTTFDGEGTQLVVDALKQGRLG